MPETIYTRTNSTFALLSLLFYVVTTPQHSLPVKEEEIDVLNRAIGVVMIIDIGRPKAIWIHTVPGIVLTVAIQIHAAIVADGVGLEEAADGGVVVSGAVVVEAGLGVELAAREHEAVGVARVGGGRLAVDLSLIHI